MKIFNIYIEIADISFENDIAFSTFFTHAFFPSKYSLKYSLYIIRLQIYLVKTQLRIKKVEKRIHPFMIPYENFPLVICGQVR